MSELVHIGEANYDELVAKSGKPALLDFGAAWCGPCKAMEPSVVALAQEYGDRVVIGKIDIDKAANLAQRFGIMSVPTVVFLREGKEVHRFVGIQSKDKIAALIQNHLLTG